MQDVLIPAATLALGYVVANWQTLLGWRNKSSRDELALQGELQKAVTGTREDILQLYKIIELMENKNMQLKTENIALKEKGEAFEDAFDSLAKMAKTRLSEISQYIDTLEIQLRTKYPKAK